MLSAILNLLYHYRLYEPKTRLVNGNAKFPGNEGSLATDYSFVKRRLVTK